MTKRLSPNENELGKILRVKMIWFFSCPKGFLICWFSKGQTQNHWYFLINNCGDKDEKIINSMFKSKIKTSKNAATQILYCIF